jgi:hypothetical protein
MEHPAAAQFKNSAKDATPTLLEAMGAARRAVTAMTGLEVDSVSHCEKAETGIWLVVVDVIESMARMGDNDLLAAYEVQIGGDGALSKFTRLKRYHREDRDQG